MKNKDLIILRGLPGCGKTTLAEKIGKAVCSADDYFVDRKGNYNWNQKFIKKAHQWCQKKCERFMQKNVKTIIISNTNTTDNELNPYYKMAEKYGYSVFSVIVENRHNGKNLHKYHIQQL